MVISQGVMRVCLNPTPASHDTSVIWREEVPMVERDLNLDFKGSLKPPIG